MNYKIDKPNAYYMRGALPTVEQSRDHFLETFRDLIEEAKELL